MIVRLGTDCTGIDAAYFALQKCLADEHQIEYKFASEIDPVLRCYLKDTVPVETVYEDICLRDNSTAPAVDIYIAGFPCQTFSSLGKRQGMNDPRGLIYKQILKYIRLKQPRIVVLENVKFILHHSKGKLFDAILDDLKASLPDHEIDYKIVCPSDIGFPQKRKRVFITAVQRDLHSLLQRNNLHKTEEVPLQNILLDLDRAIDIDPVTIRPVGANQRKRLEDAIGCLATKSNCAYNIVDLGKSAAFSTDPHSGVCPCLTRNASMFFIPEQKRYLTAVEALRLQGFSDDTVASWLALFTKSHKNKARAFLWAGNSICIPVLCYILRPLVAALTQ
jgi:DNA (cytosine-5)-methyltransferase 1